MDEQKYVTPQNLQNNQPYERVRMVAQSGRTSSVRRSSPQQSGGTEAAGLRGEPVVQSVGVRTETQRPTQGRKCPPPHGGRGRDAGTPIPRGENGVLKKKSKKYTFSPLLYLPNLMVLAGGGLLAGS